MVPFRLSFITCNLWLTERWPARAPALERFLALFIPDVLCVQELQRPTQEFLDRLLKEHYRVHDPFPDWTNEGNIYWSKAVFEKVEHGAEEVGHVEPERCMFWARLQLKSLKKPIFVATAHLTSPQHSDETETGVSPRVRQLKRIAAALTRLVSEGEPGFFMGDMNDAWHPQRILKQAGFVSCFAALGIQSPPTFKCYPTATVQPGEQTMTEAIDLITGNKYARAIAGSVPQFYSVRSLACAGDISAWMKSSKDAPLAVELNETSLSTYESSTTMSGCSRSFIPAAPALDKLKFHNGPDC